MKTAILLSILAITISCGSKDCSLIDENFNNYDDAVETIKSADFDFSEDVDTSKSSWIHDAEFYSCDGQIGYLIIETESDNYIHREVPIEIWNEFKNAESFGKYYNQHLKGRFRLEL